MGIAQNTVNNTFFESHFLYSITHYEIEFVEVQDVEFVIKFSFIVNWFDIRIDNYSNT